METVFEDASEAVEENGYRDVDVDYVGSLDGRLRISWWEAETVLNVKPPDYFYSSPSLQVCDDLCVRFKDGGIMVRTINDEEYEEWAYIPPAATYGMPFSRVDGEGIIINGIMADVNYPDENYFFS